MKVLQNFVVNSNFINFINLLYPLGYIFRWFYVIILTNIFLEVCITIQFQAK